MRGRQSTVAVAVLALAVAIIAVATPVAGVNAASPLELADQHTTDSDFNGAQTLTNVSVKGTGQSAAVSLNGPVPGTTTTLDDFNDGDIAEYGGDTGPYSAQTSTVFEGSHAIEASDNNGVSEVIADTGVSYGAGDGNLTAYMRYSGSANIDGGPVFAATSEDASTVNGYHINLAEVGGAGRARFVLLKDGGFSSTLDSAPVDIGELSGNWLRWELDWDSGGGKTATLYWDNGTAIAQISTTDTTYSGSGIGYRAYDGKQYADIYKKTTTGKPAPATGRYVSQNISVSEVQSLAANVTAQNASLNVSVEEYTGSQWQLVNNSNLTTTGNHTIDISTATQTKLRTNVTFRNLTGSTTTAELHDETFLFNSSGPDLDGGAATPQGGTTLSTTTVTLEVPLNDNDFGTAQGDNVTVDFYLDGSKISQVSRQSNGTASLTTTVSTGGSHTWSAVARSQNYSEPIDSIGNKSFAIPDTLSVRNESNASQLITGANIEVTFIGSNGTIVTRDDTNQDGNISLTGLPADESFLVEASAPGYYDRRILVDSLVQQQHIYLLNKSVVSAVAIDFTLDDRTGRFQDDDAELIVERPLNRSGATEWETIVGDQLGAAGQLPTLLEQDQRYRLTVRNGEESRVLGTYIASAPKDPEVLPISFVEISADADDSAVFGAALRDLDSGRQVRFVYFDPADATEQLKYEIVYANNTAKKLVSNTTVTDPNQRFVHTEPVPSAALANVSFEVRVHADRSGSQQDAGFNQTVGDVEDLGGQWGIDGGALELIGWVFIYAGGAMMTLRSPRLAALGIPAVAALFALTGIVSFHPVPVAIAGTMGVLYVVGGGGGP